MNTHPAALAAFVGWLLACSTHAAVIYTPHPWSLTGDIRSWPPYGISSASEQTFDLDGNGVPDVLISSLFGESTFDGVYARPFSHAEIVAAPLFGVLDPHGVAVDLLGGVSIDANTPSLYHPVDEVQWGDENFRIGTFAMLTAPYDIGQGGTFYLEFAFLGVRFQREDGWHYGWIEAAGAFGGLSVRGYAWETEPDTPIVAGAIPEPRAGMLLIAGFWFVLRRARRSPPGTCFSVLQVHRPKPRLSMRPMVRG